MRSVVDGKEREFHVKPNVFSDATLAALQRLGKMFNREKRKESLLELAAIKNEIDDETYSELQQKIVASFVEFTPGGYIESVELLRTREGLATALAMNCDDIEDSEFAMKVIEGCDSVVDVFNVLFESGNEALEAAKNLYHIHI